MNPLKTLLSVTATAALVLPAVALAESTDTTKAPSSSSQCKTLRTQMNKDGKGDFKAAYGSKSNAFGKCVSALSKAKKAEHRATVAACREERAAGTGGEGKNAFGKCVSGKAKKDGREVRSDQRNAAKSCKAERSSSDKVVKAAFDAEYGTKRNAFGKCVSATAKAKANDRNDKADEDATDGDDDSPQNDTNRGQSKKQSS